MYPCIVFFADFVFCGDVFKASEPAVVVIYRPIGRSDRHLPDSFIGSDFVKMEPIPVLLDEIPVFASPPRRLGSRAQVHNRPMRTVSGGRKHFH